MLLADQEVYYFKSLSAQGKVDDVNGCYLSERSNRCFCRKWSRNAHKQDCWLVFGLCPHKSCWKGYATHIHRWSDLETVFFKYLGLSFDDGTSIWTDSCLIFIRLHCRACSLLEFSGNMISNVKPSRQILVSWYWLNFNTVDLSSALLISVSLAIV